MKKFLLASLFATIALSAPAESQVFSGLITDDLSDNLGSCILRSRPGRLQATGW